MSIADRIAPTAKICAGFFARSTIAFWAPLILLTVGFLAPRSLAFLFPLCALPFFVEAASPDRPLTFPTAATPFLAALAAFFGFAAVSVLWSADFHWLSFTKASIGAGFAFALAACATIGFQRSPAWLDRAGSAVAVAFAIGATFLLIESLTANAIQRFWIESFGLQAVVEHRDVYVLDDNALSINPVVNNRAAVTLAVFALPVIFILWQWPMTLRRCMKAGCLVAVFALAIFKTGSETAKLASVIGLATVVVAYVSRKAAYMLLCVAWIFSCACVAPMFALAHQYGMEESRLLWRVFDGASPRERIVIGYEYARRIGEAPLFGHGINTSTTLAPMFAHPHNAYLQVWFELGAIGATLFAFLGLTLLKLMRQLPLPEQPVTFATFAVFAAIIAPSYGLWQHWQMGLFAIAGLALVTALERRRQRTEKVNS